MLKNVGKLSVAVMDDCDDKWLKYPTHMNTKHLNFMRHDYHVDIYMNFCFHMAWADPDMF